MFGKQIAAAAVLAVLQFVMPGSVLGDCPGDMNNDNVVDFADAQVFLGCMLGANVPVDAGCEAADIDLDSDADMSDFGVLQVAFGSQCGPQEIVLRDSIGPDNSMTNGNLPFSSNYRIGTAYQIMPISLTPPDTITLKTLRFVVAQQTGTNLNWAGYDYHIRVWSSFGAFSSSPTTGDLANVFFDNPTVGPIAFGFTGNVPGTGVKTTYSLEFDVTTYGIVLAAGQSFLVGLEGNATHVSNGRMAILESSENGLSDVWFSQTFPPPSGLVLAESAWSLWFGRGAVFVSGQQD